MSSRFIAMPRPRRSFAIVWFSLATSSTRLFQDTNSLLEEERTCEALASSKNVEEEEAL